jgi:hypothetical protein
MATDFIALGDLISPIPGEKLPLNYKYNRKTLIHYSMKIKVNINLIKTHKQYSFVIYTLSYQGQINQQN